ncbi:hypothetical protein MWL48_02430 [Escherichia coli]|nr:hypothetical protein [Escherichia coli]
MALTLALQEQTRFRQCEHLHSWTAATGLVLPGAVPSGTTKRSTVTACSIIRWRCTVKSQRICGDPVSDIWKFIPSDEVPSVLRISFLLSVNIIMPLRFASRAMNNIIGFPLRHGVNYSELKDNRENIILGSDTF